MDWLWLAMTISARGTDSCLHKPWQAVANPSSEMQDWTALWIEKNWPQEPAPLAPMHPPNPQAGGGITAEDLLRAVATLGTQQHALQQQEVQKLPAHLLSLVALACGADDPASAAMDHLSDFWQGFVPL